MGAVDLIGQIQRREIDAEVSGDLVAGAEVHIRGGIHEGGLGAELRAVLNLTEAIQERCLVIDRNTRLEAVLVEERDEVVRIGQARDREARHTEIVGVIRLVGADKRGIGLEPEAAIADRVLPRQFDAADLGRGTVDLRGDAEKRRRTAGQRHTIDLLGNGAADHKVGHFLDECIR